MTASSDESTRYVLPAGAPLLANLAALWNIDPALAAELESLPDDSAYPVEAAKSGDLTLSRRTADGRVIYMHSRHQPMDEAKRLCEGVDTQKNLICYVLGLGLGHQLQVLWSAAGDETVFCVFEPDLRMIWTAFSHGDFSRMISSRRLVLLTKADKAEILTRLTRYSGLILLGAQSVFHSPSLQLHCEFFSQIKSSLEDLASFVRTGMNTLVGNSAKTAENIAANIGWYAASPSAQRLQGRYKGFPAVIVSAGPSLRKNKHLLKGLDERAVLIAVQTTLQPLVEMGVRPQFVTSLDYHEICGRFFEKLPAGLRTELIAEPKATEVIFNLNPGPLTVLGNDFAESLLREMALNKTTLSAGSTVAHLAYYLAEHMGCDPIIFVGQDLAFSDGLCYLPGTSYEDVWRPELSRYCTVEMKQWEQIARERYVLRRVPDVQGNPIYTEERLFMYLQQFERDFAASGATIIDATEGGALKHGAAPMPLAEAIERYCQRPVPQIMDDHPGLDWNLLGRCIESLSKRREEGAAIARISRDTLPLLEDVRDHLSDDVHVNRTIARIDQLRAKMDTLGRTYDQVTQLTQRTELERFHADCKVAASKAQGVDRQRLQVERDIENVRAMIEAAGAFETLMEKTIARLQSQWTPAADALAA